MIRRLLPAILTAVQPLAAAEPLARYEQSQVHMGTQFRIVLYAPSDAVATKSAQAAFARIAELDARLSDYRDDSELTLLSQAAGGPPRMVSPELFLLLQRSVEFSKASDGAFDVTAGPVIRLWRRARRLHELPRPEQIESAMTRIGYTKLRLDAVAQTVQLSTPQMLIDLGGIAKGYACDQALAALRKEGVTRALVDGGGDVSVSDPPPDRPGWTIAVAPLEAAGKQRRVPAGLANVPPSPASVKENRGVVGPARPSVWEGEGQVTSQRQPRSDPPASKGNGTLPEAVSVVLSNAAIATSGDTERYVELGGKRFSHIVDPRTGWALSDRLQVTVSAPDGATADALATAVSVLGPAKGIELVDATPNAAAFVIHATDRGIETFSSRRWKEIKTVGRGQKRL